MGDLYLIWSDSVVLESRLYFVGVTASRMIVLNASFCAGGQMMTWSFVNPIRVLLLVQDTYKFRK